MTTLAWIKGFPVLGTPEGMKKLKPTVITDRIAALLATATGIGYPSLVGTSVLVGQVKGAEQQAPCVFIIPEQEQFDGAYGQHLMRRDYRLAAFAALSGYPTYSEHGLIDQIIYDVRKIMETRDGTAGIGLAAIGAEVRFVSATPGYHEDGGDLVGAALQYTLHFTQASPA